MNKRNSTLSESSDFIFATRRRVAIAMVLLLTALSFYTGLSEPVSANHAGRTLEVEFELNETDAGTTATLTARLYPNAAASDVAIDFEVESGPGDNDGNSKTTPDAGCTVEADARECTADFFSIEPGVQSIRGWIDHNPNAIVEADPTEGRYSGEYLIGTPPSDTGDCTTADLEELMDDCLGEEEAGLVGEPDQTDVVEISFTTEATRLNCEPETATRPNTGAGSSVEYTCTATDEQGNGRGGTLIDAENMEGANNPESDDEPDGDADFDDFCETEDVTGECTGTISPDEGQEGGADICFWVDSNDDGDFGEDVADGGDCADETLGETENNDTTDKTHVEWQEGAEAFPWESLGGGLVGGPDAASWASGRLDVFVRGTDNALWQRTFSGGTWQNWTGLGGGLNADPSAVSWGVDRIDVFIRGNDNALWHRAFEGTWMPWESLGGVLTSGPDVASWEEGRLDIFARGGDNAIWHMYWNGSSWSGWESLGGSLTSDPGAVSADVDTVDVFARGTDNGVWRKAWDGEAWSEWASVGGISATSGPDPSTFDTGMIDLVVRDPGNAFVHNSWDGSAWSGWESLGGTFTSSPGAVAQSDRIDAFGRGTDGALWHKMYEPPPA